MFAITEGLFGRPSACTVIDSLPSYEVDRVGSPLGYDFGVVVGLGERLGVAGDYCGLRRRRLAALCGTLGLKAAHFI